MGQITQQFDEPYSQIPQVLPGSFGASVIGIAGRPYLINNADGAYRRQAVDVVQQRNTGDSRDLLLLPQDVWRQMSQNWSFGAGQSNLDRDTALPARYEDSYGIDPWTQWQFNLLPETAAWVEDLVGDVWLTTIQNGGTEYLVVINGTTVKWYTSFGSAAAGTYTVPAGRTIIDVADDGLFPTILLDNGNVRTISVPAGAVIYNHTYAGATMVDYEKDFLVAGVANEFYDITAGGAGTKVYQHPDPNFRWVDCASGNSCIYALGGVGDKWVVHRTGIVISGGNVDLQPMIVAATLPHGEIGYSIGSYLGFVFIGTNKGVRMAQADGNGDLTLGPIIPTSAPVRCFEGQDRFVWFGKDQITATYEPVNEADVSFPNVPVCGLGRMDLSTFTVSALTPAWANDLVTPQLENGSYVTASQVTSVVTFLNRRVFAVANYGVFYETTNLMEAGYLIQGTMSFSVEDLKTGLYLQAKWKPSGGAIGLDVAFDSGNFERLVKLNVDTGIRSDNISLDGQQFSRMNARTVLYRDPDDLDSGPYVTRWEMRAIPVKGRASRWTIPIMNYENIEIDGVNYTRDVREELDILMRLLENGGIFTLQESGRLYRVNAKDFLWQPEKLASNGQGWQGMYTLIVEEVQ